MNPSLSGAQTLPDNDGQDISALLLSNRTKAARVQEREVFLYYFRDSKEGRSSAIRHRQYKLITEVGMQPLQKPQLYDLELDPREAVDLYDHPEFRRVRDTITALKEKAERRVKWRRKIVTDSDPAAMPCCQTGCYDNRQILRNCCRC